MYGEKNMTNRSKANQKDGSPLFGHKSHSALPMGLENDKKTKPSF